MAIEIFNRYENKYLINEKTFTRLEERLSDYMELDAYNSQHETYPIANIYYDTADSHLIRTSLAKPPYKEKLRLRAYGAPGGASQVYVEIKKKVSGLVNKRRSALMPREAYAFLRDGTPPAPQPYMNVQVLREVAYMLERYTLEPALYLAYDRRAYFGIGQHDLRVSFDANIRSRRRDLRFEAGDYGEPLLGGDARLMEIKAAQSIPLWLCQLLSEYRIYPVSFSKYGAEYRRTLARRQTQRLFALPPRVSPPQRGKEFEAAALARL
ncbi:MAG: polyphosphate polymerase domain-containing protein [Oscillospiraceae bacterium]|nr:polyphosphate polymerase domain-containing protein [Oscillospiraceae bacterium]